VTRVTDAAWQRAQNTAHSCGGFNPAACLGGECFFSSAQSDASALPWNAWLLAREPQPARRFSGLALQEVTHMNRIGIFLLATLMFAFLAIASLGDAQKPQQNRDQQRVHQQQRPQDRNAQREQQRGAQRQQPAPRQQQMERQRTLTRQQQRESDRIRARQVQRSTQQRRVQQADQHRVWQQYRSRRWESEHRTWRQRGGYNGYVVPQYYFQSHYGRSHWFRMYTLPFLFTDGYPRFQYMGYWFIMLEPYPEFWGQTWYQTDDCYVDYYQDGYYLYNLRYPGRPGIAVRVVF
jgi:hypothetical protein